MLLFGIESRKHFFHVIQKSLPRRVSVLALRSGRLLLAWFICIYKHCIIISSTLFTISFHSIGIGYTKHILKRTDMKVLEHLFFHTIHLMKGSKVNGSVTQWFIPSISMKCSFTHLHRGVWDVMVTVSSKQRVSSFPLICLSVVTSSCCTTTVQ